MLTKRQKFTDITHKAYTGTKLDERFETIETPVGMRLHLLPHQAIVVKAILDLETKPILDVGSERVQSSAIVLADPCGSGKTIELLSIILHCPIPSAWPSYLTIGDKQRILVTKKYTQLIKSTLVVVGSSVLVQWKKAIQDHTVLSVFTIASYYDLCSFSKTLEAGTLIEDIVLLKNGPISGSLTSDDVSTRSSIVAIAGITKGQCWARVIYDDFDVIKIAKEAERLPSLSTIYVSATKKQAPRLRRLWQDSTAGITMDDIKYNPKLADICYTKDYLFTNFSIKSDKAFLERSLITPKINYYKYVFDSSHARYVELIGQAYELNSLTGVQDTKHIMEMLNGDAVKTAAQALNIKTTSISDIFERVLDQKYEGFIKDQKLIVAIQKAIGTYEVLPVSEEKISKEEIASVINSIKKYHVHKLERVPPIVLSSLREWLTATEQSRDINGLAISRVISNIKEGDCQICYESLASTSIFINRCCGVILCQVCGVKGNRLVGSSKEIKGSCPMCRRVLTIADLLFVDKSTDLNSIMNAMGDEEDMFVEAKEDTLVEGDVIEAKEVKKKQTFTKSNVIASLIACQFNYDVNPLPTDLPNRVSIDKQIPNLMQGTTIINNASIMRKVCIFANYEESLDQIEASLKAKDISFMRLKGTAKQMDATIQSFKMGNVVVLLINSLVKCAGLNLEFMTDLIFCHQIYDPSIEGQVLGRGQRYGRTSNLNVHYLYYTHEDHN